MAMEYMIDGTDKVLGRLASQAAKLLLKKDSVVVVNAGKVVITGHVQDLTAKYKQRIELKDKANPEHSPYWSRRPDMFVKRVVRGMLPYKKPSGKAAYKRLRVYDGFPEEAKKLKVFDVESKKPNQIFENTITVTQLMQKLGYKGR
jgi:large subunit ribosomal protein L13